MNWFKAVLKKMKADGHIQLARVQVPHSFVPDPAACRWVVGHDTWWGLNACKHGKDSPEYAIYQVMVPTYVYITKAVESVLELAGGLNTSSTDMGRATRTVPGLAECVGGVKRHVLCRFDRISQAYRTVKVSDGESRKMADAIDNAGDGGYDARYVFSLLASLGITPIIKIRTNANARSNGVGRARALAALEQFGGVGGCSNEEFNRMTKAERQLNQKRWKKDVRSGLRWIVEIVISAFKSVFGESVRALKPRTAIIEIATKVAAYNRNLDIRGVVVGAMRRPPDTGPPTAAWPWSEATAA